MMTTDRAKDAAEQKKFIDAINKAGVSLSFKGNLVIIESKSAVSVLLAKNALTAFNRGFDAKTSLLLLDENYDLAVLNIGNYANSQKRQIGLKGRIIGSRGVIKQRLSNATSCYIKIFGKTVSIIGNYQNLNIAVEAVEMLLNGAKHDRVFLMIDKRKLEAYGDRNS